MSAPTIIDDPLDTDQAEAGLLTATITPPASARPTRIHDAVGLRMSAAPMSAALMTTWMTTYIRPTP